MQFLNSLKKLVAEIVVVFCALGGLVIAAMAAWPALLEAGYRSSSAILVYICAVLVAGSSWRVAVRSKELEEIERHREVRDEKMRAAADRDTRATLYKERNEELKEEVRELRAQLEVARRRSQG